MMGWKRWWLVMGVVFGAGIGGCRHHAESATTRQAGGQGYSPFREPARMEGRLIENPSVMLAGGRLPLTLVFDSGGHLRVVDGGSRQVLAEADAPRGSLVSVTEEMGVWVGSRTILSGPLPGERVYEIWWDSKPAVKGNEPRR